MGRTSAPAALKLLNGRHQGVDSGGRAVLAPPAFKRVPPAPPTWLSREAKAEWRRVSPGLARLDLVKEEDRAAFATYCETWSEFVQACKTLAAHGSLTIVVAQGEIPHPAVTIRRAASQQLRSWAREFGLTPAAENSLATKGGGDGAEENPFAG